jgi:hypothetical protein
VAFSFIRPYKSDCGGRFNGHFTIANKGIGGHYFLIKGEIIPHIFHLENPHEVWIVVGKTRWLHAKKQLL